MQSHMTRERPSRDEFTFCHRLRVRWAEVDAQGIVFNPHYFAYADVGMTEYMRTVGFPYPTGLLAFGADIFAVRSEAEFMASAKYDDELDLAVRIEYLGRTSLRFRTAIFRGEELLTAIRITYVNATVEERRPAPLAKDIVERILAFERTPPERKT